MTATNYNPRGAVATFYHLRRLGMAGRQIFPHLRKWAFVQRSPYTPHPLDLQTRKDMEARYSKEGAYTGD